MELTTAMRISVSGLKAQGTRMRVIAENLANTDSVNPSPGEDPYRRKVVTFKNALDRTTGLTRVSVDKVGVDNSEFSKRYEPGHPAADDEGYIYFPNVNGVLEAVDMRQAQRTYEANLNAVETAKAMSARTLDLLR